MRRVRVPLGEPLPDGTYTVLGLVPQTTAVSKNGWVTFYRGGKHVWDCNATYAAAHYPFQAKPPEEPE